MTRRYGWALAALWGLGLALGGWGSALGVGPPGLWWAGVLVGVLAASLLLLGRARREQRRWVRWQRDLRRWRPEKPPLEPPFFDDLTFAVYQALTRAHRAHLRHLRVNERWQAVFRQMRDGVLLVDPHGRVVDINPAAGALLDVDPPWARGRTLAQVVRHHRLVALWEGCRREGGEQRETLELPQTQRFVQAIAVPLEDPEVSGLLLLQDLTRLRQLETVRRDFLANLSHELRTPLASLQALAETLQAGALEDPEAARRFLARITQEVASLGRLVEDLMDLTRLESGRVSFRMAPERPCDLLAEAVERARLEAEAAGLELTWEAPEDLPPVLADRDRILQVLANLVNNALRFTPAGGSIRLEAERVDEGVRFWVRDTGIGIPEEHLPRIFERFYKVDAARQKGGTGLGLAIVKHIVEAHGGRVGVESRVGEGSAFWFLLPTS